MSPEEWGELEEQARQARVEGRGCIVGAHIVNSEGCVYVHQRSLERLLFPGWWDVPAGHVEPGESLHEALAREVYEETGWTLAQVNALVEVFDYELPDRNGEIVTRRVFSFLIDVTGDLERPQLDPAEASRFLWVDSSNLEIVKENRPPDDNVMVRLVRKAMQLHAATLADG